MFDLFFFLCSADRLWAKSPHMAFKSLVYLMDIDWLTEAYRRTRKDDAEGVDGVIGED